MSITTGQSGSKLRARFFRDGNRDLIEVNIVGDPNTVIRKITPVDLEMWPEEWKAYQAGVAVVDPGGTPITDVPGVLPPLAMTLRLKGVRNAEELAALDDAAVKVVGMQGMALRTAAQNLLAARELAEMRAQQAKKPRKGPQQIENGGVQASAPADVVA